MLQPVARQSENWKFSHAAAAMGAYWARAREVEAHRPRVEKIRRRLLTGTGANAGTPAKAQPGATPQN